MNKLLSKYSWLLSLDFLVGTLFFVLVFVFWYVVYPQALSYQEQYQLFLWTGDYFSQSVSLPGGLAYYIGEFFTQFYYIEWLGAAILACLFTVLVIATRAVLPRSLSYDRTCAPLVPAVLILAFIGDESVMLSYLVAIIISLLMAALVGKANVFVDLVIVPLLYWMVGPMAWLYLLVRVLRMDKVVWWKALLMVLYLVTVQLLAYNVLLKQWTLADTFYGIGYYRLPGSYPMMAYLAPAVIVAIILLAKLIPSVLGRKASLALNALVVGLCGFLVTNAYDRDKYELIKQDYLIRHERWSDVIRSAEEYSVPVNFWSESVNLSLAMTGQLSQRMFAFYQSGQDALIMPMVRDMTSNLPTMEAFYRLGMTNECLRYAFDLQESIPHGKRSGRLTKRIVECCIVSGRYDVARKHLQLLKRSLFYRTWAENTEAFIGNEAMINSHPVYGKMRRSKFNVDFLFYYPELTKVFYHLFMSNTDNKMALEYMLGQALLEGDANMFMQLVGAVNQFGGYSGMPYTYQDAIKCIQARGNAPGSRYGEYAGRMKKAKDLNYELKNAESVH